MLNAIILKQHPSSSSSCFSFTMNESNRVDANHSPARPSPSWSWVQCRFAFQLNRIALIHNSQLHHQHHHVVESGCWSFPFFQQEMSSGKPLFLGLPYWNRIRSHRFRWRDGVPKINHRPAKTIFYGRGRVVGFGKLCLRCKHRHSWKNAF